MYTSDGPKDNRQVECKALDIANKIASTVLTNRTDIHDDVSKSTCRGLSPAGENMTTLLDVVEQVNIILDTILTSYRRA